MLLFAEMTIPANEIAQEILMRMNSHSKGSLCTILGYPGAGHLIKPPFAAHCYATYHKAYKQIFVWGGNAKDHSQAQEDSWPKILEFLRKNLGRGHNSHL